MSGGNTSNNPFSLGSTTGSESTPGGFFALPTPWGQKVSEPMTTGQQKEQPNAAIFSSGASGTHPLFRPSIFGQPTGNENAQRIFGNTAEIPARSIFAPITSDRITETVSMGVHEARTETDSSPLYKAGGSNVFGKSEKPGIFSSHLEENSKFVKPQTDTVRSLFSESLFGKALEASKALPGNEGLVKTGAGIFGKVAEQRKDVGIFGGTQTKATTSIGSGFFGKPLHSSTTDGEKLNEALFGKQQTDTKPFGAIFARSLDANKNKETVFGNKQDTPSIFGNANIFEKGREASDSNVRKSDTNLFQPNTARDSPNIFGMASGSNVQKDEPGNVGGHNTDSRSGAINPFGGETKAVHQVGPHPRDPRTVRPGLFGQALGQALGSSHAPTKGSPKKTDTTTSVSTAELQTLVSLYISDVPSEVFDKSLLLKHFSKFGTVTKIMLSNARKSCSVKFENHESAEQARSNGTQIGNIRLHIFWSKSGSLGHGERRPLKVYQKEDESGRPRSKAQRETQPPKRQPVADSKFAASGPSLYDLEDDVQAELNAMLLPNTSSFSSKLPPAPQPKENRGNKLLPRAVSTLARAKRRSSPLSLREAPSARTAMEEEVPLSISNTTLEELTKVLRSQAHSAEERYRVLEARDKMMRMKRVRQSDLAKARINRGTCPDMCPEKERYHREFQRQVAAYETGGASGKMDHRAAIKQYSRSSADQEEPLSHELRPASALRLTMDYLMWKLMDICDKKDESMADWYHYIWDRTRGIRKDITQQELSDESSVELVEQCARWHIFCSERLIAEDLMVYDDNINTENLTKCLQTLKYMYLDLSLKGVTCPNEAEFRAYFVMLNLNEGDCMWEVQQLSSVIRESEPVRFALQVSTALASNNYIRFFKLVRSTTYLNACILHRYFAQVRSQALQTMVKAFCSRAKETVFTLEDVVSLSGFENTQEAATLCAHHGLQLSEDRTSVVFSRNTFYLPDSALPATRVMSLVDAKRSCSVGAVVSGGAQPRTDFQAHVPHDSFDGNGVLKPRAWTAQDQETGNAVGTAVEIEATVDYGVGEGEEQEALGLQETEEEDDGRYGEDGVDLMREAIMRQMVENKCEQTMNEVLEAVVEDEVCSIVGAEMKNAFVDDATTDFADDIINAVTEEMVSSICTEEVAAAIAAKEEELRQKRLEAEAEMLRKMREKRFMQELNKYLDEFALECVEQVMAEEQEFEDWLTKSTDNIVEDFVQEECHLLARESIAAARLVEVNAIYERIQKRQLKLHFKQWQDFVVKSKLRKQSMADFPAWMSNLSLDEQAASLTQPDPYLIENMNRVRYASNKSKLRALEQEPPPIPKLDVATTISAHISMRMREVGCHDAYLYWKLVSSGPDTQEAPRNSSIIKRWANQIFSLDDKTPMRMSRISPNSYETLTVCVQSLTGHVENTDASQGANGILFWLSHKDTSFVNARKRLSRLLDTLRKVPAIPVAVVPTGGMSISNKQIHKELDLVLHREGMRVSYFKVFPRTSNSGLGLRKQVGEACQFLAEVASQPPPVVVLPMRQLMSRCLIDELWGVVKPTTRTQDPNTMIELYNRALHKVKDMLYDASLSEYSLGAQEFKKYLLGDSQHKQRQYHIAPSYWGSQQYYTFVSKVLSKAEMPLLEPWPPASNADLKDVIVQYCDSQGLPQVVSSLFLLIEQQARIRHRLSYPPAQPCDWKSFLKSISWCSVIETIVEAKLSALDYGRFVPANGSEFQVAVNLQGFKTLQTWLIEHLYILDLTESIPDVCCNEEKIGQKRSLEDDLPQPSKQRKLSMVEIYSNIKASFNRLDSAMSSVKTKWQDVDKEIAHKS